MPDNFTDFVDAACKHRFNQLTAGEAIHPALHGFLRTRHRLRLILRRCGQQIGLCEGVVGVIQRIGPVQ